MSPNISNSNIYLGVKTKKGGSGIKRDDLCQETVLADLKVKLNIARKRRAWRR